jgi:hypothetical protein
MSGTFAQTETEAIPGIGEVTIHLQGTVDAHRAH